MNLKTKDWIFDIGGVLPNTVKIPVNGYNSGKEKAVKEKLLILMLVLGMASSASAAIVSPMEIVDTGGGTFAINLPSGMSSAVDEAVGGYFALVGDATNPITGGTLQMPPAPDGSGLFGDVAGAGVGLANGIYGFFGSPAPTWSSPAGIYAKDFLSNTTDGTITLYSITDYGVWTVDTYVVPEPATICLLALGGLLLLRRRK